MRNLFLHLALLVVLSVLVSSCSESNTTKKEKDVEGFPNHPVGSDQKLKTKTSAIDEVTDSSKEKTSTQIKKQPDEKIYLIINGNKFEANSTTLTKGDIVTDLSMYEKAKVTGELVVVASDENFDIAVFEPDYKVRSIAKATFRLTPTQTSNLLLDYKQLKQTPGVKAVEVQLDYSPLDDDRATY